MRERRSVGDSSIPASLIICNQLINQRKGVSEHMFGNNNDKADYYAADDGKVYRSEDFRHGFSPVWLLPILLIPLALLVWGGSELLKNTNTPGLTLNKSANTANQVSSSNAGGSDLNVANAPTVTPTPTMSGPTPTKSPSVTPTNKAKTQVGVGGGPEVSPAESTVPQTPYTGHGW